MDEKLLAWARSVKARCRGAGRRVGGGSRALGHWPPLWVFSDWHRLPDPARLIVRLPPGLCGLVHRPRPGVCAAELRRVQQLCRAHRVALTIAGPLGAPGCGEHRAGGRRQLRRAGVLFATASAHGVADLVRAERAGVALVFLSPVFPTASHPGGRSLGVLRWAAMARARRVPVLALGGLTGAGVRRLPGFAAGVGAIGAMATSGG